MGDARAFRVGDWVRDEESFGRVAALDPDRAYSVGVLFLDTLHNRPDDPLYWVPPAQLEPYTPTDQEVYEYCLAELTR